MFMLAFALFLNSNSSLIVRSLDKEMRANDVQIFFSKGYFPVADLA